MPELMNGGDVYKESVRVYENKRRSKTLEFRNRLQSLLMDALPNDVSIYDLKQTAEQLERIVAKVWSEHYPKEQPQ